MKKILKKLRRLEKEIPTLKGKKRGEASKRIEKSYGFLETNQFAC